MRSTFKVLFYLKRNAPKKSGLIPVMCRITVNGKIAQFSCKLDVVQESIVKALAKSDTLRRPEYLKTWFYRILLNESMNHHRRAKRLVPLEDTLLETPAPARDPGERLDLYDAIERLDWKEQTVVRLRFFEDMKLEEIARVTNTNLNTVKSRLYKSLRRLRELTEEEC